MKRKKHKVQHNTEKWHNLRKGLFTSSNISDLFVEPKTNADKANGILSVTAQNLIEEKALELINNKPFIQDFQTAAMEWGHECEPISAIEYAHFTGNSISDGCFWTYGQNTGSSPDRLIFDDGVLELKNPYNQSEHLFNLLHIKTPADLLKHRKQYFYQCHHQIYTTGREYCDWVSFDKRLLDSKNIYAAMVIVRIYKDAGICQQFDEKIEIAAQLRDKILNEVLEYQIHQFD